VLALVVVVENWAVWAVVAVVKDPLLVALPLPASVVTVASVTVELVHVISRICHPVVAAIPVSAYVDTPPSVLCRMRQFALSEGSKCRTRIPLLRLFTYITPKKCATLVSDSSLMTADILSPAKFAPGPTPARYCEYMCAVVLPAQFMR